MNESILQQQCVEWFRWQYPQYARVLIHVPNEGRRSMRVVYNRNGIGRVICTGGRRLVAEGMIAGVSDLILLVSKKRYATLCIELKYGKGRLSKQQKEWRQHATEAGNKYAVCRSLEEFQDVVNKYLSSDSRDHFEEWICNPQPCSL